MTSEKHAKLRWKCRRGMREMDIVFIEFLENHYATAPIAIQHAFEQLIDEQDPIIVDYLFARTPAPNEDIDTVIQTMRSIEKGNKRF